ncbi:hypothetical protein KGQ19_42025 [Catenulispora sp. NL8]|uniref:Uncharacterized protein n=1 Tax=Catenulispora pinistramenti TaxID=2705254 RepID=A0ABS5L527_9ACTN|nr:hypothetical protein [Catenulispora pinistramenti]MBS2553451.1 hypothetical protein [Catenulispora pinistramenti]
MGRSARSRSVVNSRSAGRYAERLTLDAISCVSRLNNSARPIRNVMGRVTVGGAGTDWTFPVEVYEADVNAEGQVANTVQTQNLPIQIMRKRTIREFLFDLTAKNNRCAAYLLRFTDDAGWHWEPTDDMHLTQISDRSDW